MISKLLFNKGSFIFTAVIASSLFAVSTSAQAADPRELLERMSTELAGLDSFILSGDAYADARLDAGQIIENSSQATMRVRKPDAMRLTMRNEEGVKEVVFGSGVLTLYSEKDNFYAQTEIPEGLGAAVDVAINDVGIDAPMLDLLSNNFGDQLLIDAEEVTHLGASLIRGKMFEHIAIRNSEADIQIWIAADGPPLPGKMVISSKWEGGSPRFVVFFDWDTDPDLPTGAVSFAPPANATKIEFLFDQDL